jgi:hypothetical protein
MRLGDLCLIVFTEYGESTNTAGIYGSVAAIFLF